MRFYEFETKRLLARYGIPAPQGKVAETASEELLRLDDGDGSPAAGA